MPIADINAVLSETIDRVRYLEKLMIEHETRLDRMQTQFNHIDTLLEATHNLLQGIQAQQDLLATVVKGMQIWAKQPWWRRLLH